MKQNNFLHKNSIITTNKSQGKENSNHKFKLLAYAGLIVCTNACGSYSRQNMDWCPDPLQEPDRLPDNVQAALDAYLLQARERAEREATERAEREAREKEEKEARERAEKEARERAEKEARERAEREEKVARAAREEREARDREE